MYYVLLRSLPRVPLQCKKVAEFGYIVVSGYRHVTSGNLTTLDQEGSKIEVFIAVCLFVAVINRLRRIVMERESRKAAVSSTNTHTSYTNNHYKSRYKNTRTGEMALWQSVIYIYCCHLSLAISYFKYDSRGAVSQVDDKTQHYVSYTVTYIPVLW